MQIIALKNMSENNFRNIRQGNKFSVVNNRCMVEETNERPLKEFFCIENIYGTFQLFKFFIQTLISNSSNYGHYFKTT